MNDNIEFESDDVSSKKRKSNEIRHIARLNRGFKAILDNDDSLYLFNFILDSAHIFMPTTEVSGEILAYKAGQRDLGLMLWNGLVGSNPEFVTRLIKFREELKNGTE